LATDNASWLTLHTAKQVPEYVEGISGNGLRTDGYSTWVETAVHQSVHTLSGWFALESFPTDTAGYIGIGKASGSSVAVCVDRFGTLLVATGRDAVYTYQPVDTKVERFKWLHLLMDLKGNALYVNGKRTGQLTNGTLETFSEGIVLFGKDVRNKRASMYNLSTINGLIDEVVIGHTPPDMGNRRAAIEGALSNTPTLAIPAVRFANDYYRPRYHVLPAANWTNETHGLLHYKGQWHIFNQKNASNIMLRQMNWGHFSSPDLVHWTEQKPAIIPSMPYDKNGIWSGHAVIDDNGTPVLIYTAGSEKYGVGLAYPKDDMLIEWEKYAGNPVIAEKPDRYVRTDMRDQYVWKEGNTWYMIIGFGIEKAETPHGTVLLYKSKDLHKWQFVHLLYEGNPEVDDTGVFWEMPVFMKMGKKYVLMINPTPQRGKPARTRYWIGDFKNEKFIPDHPVPKNLEVINRLLSPSVQTSPDGDMVAMAIIPSGGMNSYKQGWAHLYSIPRVWELKEGRIVQRPHPALTQLRSAHQVHTRQPLTKVRPRVISIGERQLEINATFYPGDARRFGFVLYKNSEGTEQCRIYYDADTKELVIEQTTLNNQQSFGGFMQRPGQGEGNRTPPPVNRTRITKDTYTADISGAVNIRLFIDASVIEGFINNQDAFTASVTPTDAGFTQMELFAEGTTSEAEADVWVLKSSLVESNF
jgi:beta-fructofuranosidase